MHTSCLDYTLQTDGCCCARFHMGRIFNRDVPDVLSQCPSAQLLLREESCSLEPLGVPARHLCCRRWESSDKSQPVNHGRSQLYYHTRPRKTSV